MYEYIVKDGRIEQINSTVSYLYRVYPPKQFPQTRERKIREKAFMSMRGVALLAQVPYYHYLAWESGTGFIPTEEVNRIRNIICILESNQDKSIKSKIPVRITKSIDSINPRG